MKIHLIERPRESDWMGVKIRALVTQGRVPKSPPSMEWRRAILRARHSPIRYLRFSFLLEDVPYWVTVHLCRHIHAQPYVGSQRNDRQERYDRTKAPQDTPVSMIWDLNAEELLNVANKRLCGKASPKTRDVVREMCRLAVLHCPEFEGVLVPMCEYHGGQCHEMQPCSKKGEKHADR